MANVFTNSINSIWSWRVVYLNDDVRALVQRALDSGGSIITAQVTTTYGEVATALERLLESSAEIELVDIVDRCEI